MCMILDLPELSRLGQLSRIDIPVEQEMAKLVRSVESPPDSSSLISSDDDVWPIPILGKAIECRSPELIPRHNYALILKQRDHVADWDIRHSPRLAHVLGQALNFIVRDKQCVVPKIQL